MEEAMIKLPSLKEVLHIAGHRVFGNETVANVSERVGIGFVYDVEVVRGGKVIDHEQVHNLFPTAALNDILKVYLSANGAGTLKTAWFVGIFEGNYTPVAGDLMSTFVANSTESTAYAEATRRTLTLSTPASGSTNNTASRATFTMNATKTIYGAFISDNSAKSSTTTMLLSAAKFSTSKALEADDQLLVGATLTLTP
jgi:hypothetical protein